MHLNTFIICFVVLQCIQMYLNLFIEHLNVFECIHDIFESNWVYINVLIVLFQFISMCL
jgi:hypothetical protein